LGFILSLLIIGGVGSGKSSFGSALIGDIEKIEGILKIQGSIAYCPQVAWINNNSVKFFFLLF
jgi:ABC-type Mn2+/Zn2+ transport system ATPase subunit